MTKVETVVIRERIETVIDAVEEETGHVGVTVIEAVGHGRERGVTHEYRGRVFESRFLPKALLIFVVDNDKADAVVHAIVSAARSGNESGDGRGGPPVGVGGGGGMGAAWGWRGGRCRSAGLRWFGKSSYRGGGV